MASVYQPALFGRRWGGSWRSVALVALLVGLPWQAASDLPPDAFRIGFSSTLFTDVHENDARASVKVWAQTLTRERAIPADPDALILTGIPAMQEALKNRRVDLLAVRVDEYRALIAETPLSPIIFVAYAHGRAEEEVLLLVHGESGIERVEDLRGRTLVVYNHARASLALPWFDTLLRETGLPPAAEFVSALTQNTRLSGVVLPVFFRKADACLVTRGAFEAMAELNPQLGNALTALAASPMMLPVVLVFRADYAPPFMEDIFAGLRDLHLSPAGRQVLTIFKSEKLEERPASALQSALDLLERAEKLTDKGVAR